MIRRVLLLSVFFICLFTSIALLYNNEPVGWAGWIWGTDYLSIKMWLVEENSASIFGGHQSQENEAVQLARQLFIAKKVLLDDTLANQSIKALAYTYSLSTANLMFTDLVAEYIDVAENAGLNPISCLEGLDSSIASSLKGYGYSVKDVFPVILGCTKHGLKLVDLREALKNLLYASSKNQGLAVQKWHAIINSFKTMGDTGISAILKIDLDVSKRLTNAAEDGVFEYGQSISSFRLQKEWKSYDRLDDSSTYYGFTWDRVTYFFLNNSFSGVCLSRSIAADKMNSQGKLQQLYGSEYFSIPISNRNIQIWVGANCSIAYSLSNVDPQVELLLIGMKDFILSQLECL